MISIRLIREIQKVSCTVSISQCRWWRAHSVLSASRTSYRFITLMYPLASNHLSLHAQLGQSAQIQLIAPLWKEVKNFKIPFSLLWFMIFPIQLCYPLSTRWLDSLFILMIAPFVRRTKQFDFNSKLERNTDQCEVAVYVIQSTSWELAVKFEKIKNEFVIIFFFWIYVS